MDTFHLMKESVENAALFTNGNNAKAAPQRLTIWWKDGSGPGRTSSFASSLGRVCPALWTLGRPAANGRNEPIVLKNSSLIDG